MKGLLIKDYKLMLGQKSFLGMAALMAVLYLIIYKDPIVAVIFITVMCTMFTVSTLSYDEYENGLDKDTSGGWCSMLLILLSVILTGFNIYPSIANWGGAGALVPITGFANGVAAPAIEFQKEGQVFGIGCKIFTIAGPVILYGIVSSWVLGLIYWIFW